MDPYIGEIRMFGGNYAPRGWAFCNGQLLAINQYTALFSILGVTYGGNGSSTFGLPNLQGRVAMHWGNGPGLTPHVLGETAGVENVQLLTSQMPAHTHTISASSAAANASNPSGSVPALYNNEAGDPVNIYGTTANTVMAPTMASIVGQGLPHTNMQPYQCVSYIIALEGIFPPRD